MTLGLYAYCIPRPSAESNLFRKIVGVARDAHFRMGESGAGSRGGSVGDGCLPENCGRSHNKAYPLSFQIEFIQPIGGVLQKIALPCAFQIENVVPLRLVVSGEGLPLEVLIKE